jgi:chorismate mutase
MLTLSHEAGMLSRVLNAISDFSVNILNITQSLPVHGKVSIVLTLDLAETREPIERLLEVLQGVQGAENIHLLAVE